MKTVLVVDDNADIRRLLAITLGRDYTVIEADDGENALKSVRRHRPDAILLDTMMPGALDGLQVLQAIRADPHLKHTKVAMITACGQAADFRAGLANGADAYFIKPFRPLQIINWLTKI